MFWLILSLSAVFAYFLGSVNFSIIFTRRALHRDIREMGSGNAGGTNTMRVLGKKAGVLVMALDMLKGVIAVLLPQLVFFICNFGDVDDVWLCIIGIFAIAGHLFPVYYGFRGGKGIAATGGVLLAISPVSMLVLFTLWGIIVALTRYVSLGSVCAGALIPFSYFLFEHFLFGQSVDRLVFALIPLCIMGATLICSHIPNIKRLLNGTENKLGAKKEG